MKINKWGNISRDSSVQYALTPKSRASEWGWSIDGMTGQVPHFCSSSNHQAKT